MRVRIYVTSNGDDRPSVPTLYVREETDVRLPDHPDRLAWSYFATVNLCDPLLDFERDSIAEALEDGGHFMGRELPL